MYNVLPDSDAILAQFNRLMQELISGTFRRNSFRPWEIELLVDLDSCELGDPSKREVLRRYQKAVQRQMAKGARMPMKLSEYLEAKEAKRVVRTSPPSAGG
jgi:hypothetical protein